MTGRIDGFVLAGGRSRRMGRDKAWVAFPGDRPMALEVADRLALVCGRVALVRRALPEPRPWPEGVEVLRDGAPEGDAHPLWGVACALAASRTRLALLAPCDHPWLDPGALRRLIEAAGPDGAVARDADRVHPLLCVLPAARADEAVAAADRGQSVRRFVRGCTEVVLPASSLRDLDHWEELVAARDEGGPEVG